MPRIRVYMDTIPVPILDDAFQSLPATGGATIPVQQIITRDFLAELGLLAAPGPHVFIMTITPAAADVAGGNTVKVPIGTGRISATLARTP